MNKLQLYICKSTRDFKSMCDINPSEEVRPYIKDVRNALAITDYNPAEKHLFYLISYTPLGVLFTIMRTIPGNALDHLATTIFVPAGLQISGEQMSAVVRQTTRIVSNPSVTAADLATLRELFSREYHVDKSVGQLMPSAGRQYAFCYYGGDGEPALESFFGEALYQPDFTPYAGILLIDGALGVTAQGIDVNEILNPDEPEPEVEPNEQPQSASKSSSRKGKKIYRFELQLIPEDLCAPIQFEIESNRSLKASPVEGYEVNGKLREGVDHINYLDFAGGGYSDDGDEEDDSSSDRFSMSWLIYIGITSLIVGLLLGWVIFHKPAPKIVAGSQADAVEAIEERRQQAAEEPTAAPEVTETTAPVVADAEPAKAEPVKAEDIVAAATPASGAVSDAAIAYLDKNKQWSRSEMEKFPELRGLYDDMNSYNRARITDYWAKRLSKSKVFGKVAHHTAEGARKKIFKPSGTFNSADKETIFVQSYLNRVDPARN